MAHAESFDDLDIYKLARQLSKRIYVLTKEFPRQERYSLTDQIRRSSRSIGAQIAEAWAKRKYENHFISKLTDADGEQYETRHWVLTALDSELWNSQTANDLISQYKILGRRINGTMAKSGVFCRH